MNSNVASPVAPCLAHLWLSLWSCRVPVQAAIVPLLHGEMWNCSLLQQGCEWLVLKQALECVMAMAMEREPQRISPCRSHGRRSLWGWYWEWSYNLCVRNTSSDSRLQTTVVPFSKFFTGRVKVMFLSRITPWLMIWISIIYMPQCTSVHPAK